MSWIAASFHFSAFFSYRIPNLSPSYALASIIPSPSSIKLALVDVAIKCSGSIDYGIEIFDVIKNVKIEIEPPDMVSVLKFFIKRLKPSKSKNVGFEESFGIREYCHFLGPLKIYFYLPSSRQNEIIGLLQKLRRLGTTDSLLSCQAHLIETQPNVSLTCKLLNEIKPDSLNLKGRPVVVLNELREEAEFTQVNPYAKGKKGTPFVLKTYILPLVEKKKGENFVLYEKKPFLI